MQDEINKQIANRLSLSSFFIGMEIEEDSKVALDDISIGNKIRALPPKNHMMMEEILDVLLKYP
ncbi:MAG: hypothetical protein NC313_05545 [Butyrivibrio sp.]|nr:hypothetical protein [Butyrivibrio sp.]